MEHGSATATASPNIAFVKYWGKRDEELILPYNSSVSMTLDDSLNTVTSVLFSKELNADRFFINGEEQDLSDNDIAERFKVVGIMRRKAGSADHVLVVSRNSFPTASGLASSASGTAALVYACSRALGLKLSAKELSIIARQGSGSSCRSILGGIVVWKKGRNADGSDSYAKRIAKKEQWPDLIDIIAIVSTERKRVLSRSGMKQTVESSSLFKARAKFAERNSRDFAKAVKSKDFDSMASIIMKESNDMHAVMLDTYPPIIYLNDVSKEIIAAIHGLNESSGKALAAYTFDAGPNAHIITLKGNEEAVRNALSRVDGIRETITAGIGSGPRALSEKDSLIDMERLMPKS
ncbi:MAG: diphosphomevalonate decarboxylase [Candidatus Micrarchaeota archaeon]|nr:diphosphomevalonate decarboxylase [Candidatus Micrarchaeota archaeon]MDE1824073.1 diphosphomevalonate decarboxylase [Candidatus Micrarchaeota archaeon]